MGVEGGGGYASSDTFIGKGLEKSILLSEVGWARTRTQLQGQRQREEAEFKGKLNSLQNGEIEFNSN